MKGGLTVENNSFRIPLSVTISRKTGEVIRAEWQENATLDEFMPVFEWIKEASERATAARRQDVKNRKEVKTAPRGSDAGCATRCGSPEACF
jgi:hypothetical protein